MPLLDNCRVAPTVGSGLEAIVGATLTAGSLGTARAGAAATASAPTATTMKLTMRLDKSPPPCGPVREPTSWLESIRGQFDHSSRAQDIKPSNDAATYRTLNVAANPT